MKFDSEQAVNISRDFGEMVIKIDLYVFLVLRVQVMEMFGERFARCHSMCTLKSLHGVN
jgi:hypothetical protein